MQQNSSSSKAIEEESESEEKATDTMKDDDDEDSDDLEDDSESEADDNSDSLNFERTMRGTPRVNKRGGNVAVIKRLMNSSCVKKVRKPIRKQSADKGNDNHHPSCH